MNCSSFSFPRRSGEQGIALILVLTILALAAILVIAFAVSMRTESTGARAFNDMMRARLIAQGGLEEARKKVASLANDNMIVPGGGGMADASHWPTLKASAPSGGSGLGDFDLNAALLITGSNSVYFGSNAVFRSSFDPVGFVYWMDAESCKININVANRRDPGQIGRSDPGDIDLRALEPPFANASDAYLDSLVAARSSPGAPCFTTPEEVRRGDSTMTAADYEANKFYLTTYSAANNNNVALDISTLGTVTSFTDTPYQKIWSSPFTDSDSSPVMYPNPSCRTFYNKYGLFGARQILANMVEYSKPWDPAAPAFGNVASGGIGGLDAAGIPILCSGLKKVPMIDDIVVHVATNYTNPPSNTRVAVRVYTDIKLVNGYDTARGAGFQVRALPDKIVVYYTTNGVPLTTNVSPSEVSYTLPADVPAHSYATLGTPLAFANIGIDGFTTNPVITAVDVSFKSVRLLSQHDPLGRTIVDWFSALDNTNAMPDKLITGATTNGCLHFASGSPWGGDIVPYQAGVSPDFTGLNPAYFKPIGIGKQDPRVRTFNPPGFSRFVLGSNINQLWTNWQVLAAGNCLPNGDRPYTSRLAPTVFGLLADVRSRDPAGPAGDASHRYLIDQIKEAPITSLAELMNIHTGYPWRTIRLRSLVPETSTAGPPYVWGDPPLAGPDYYGIGDPNSGYETVETNKLPDWTLIDWLTIGTNAVVAGRINPNQRFVYPCWSAPALANDCRDMNSPASNLAARLPPLAALINNTSTNLSLAVAPDVVTTIASNIAQYVLVPNSPYTNFPGYTSAGQMCEVAGLGYFNDAVQYPTKAHRQQIIGRIWNLVTPRSNAFSVWTYGQFKDPITGTPNASVWIQAVMELTGDPAKPVRYRYLRYYY
jgi:hypothetical protein